MAKTFNLVQNELKELPNNIEAEQSIIGSILLSNEIFDDINEDNPWVKVVFTGAAKSSQWFKKDSLIVINKKHSHRKRKHSHQEKYL